MELLYSDIDLPVFDYLRGMCSGLAAGSMIIMILFTTGTLAKIKEKKVNNKDNRIITYVCIIIVVITFVKAVLMLFKQD